MISGPAVTRTRAGLQDLMERQLDQVEGGLRVLQFEFELESGCLIDAIGVDAARRPVLLIACDPQAPDDLAGRVLVARAWLRSGASVLRDAVAAAQIDWGLPPRVVVVGFDIAHGDLQRLSCLETGSVEVYQLRPFKVGGQERIGSVPLLGPAVGRDEAPFDTPSGIIDNAQRAACSEFLELVQRMDPDIVASGDRYTRRVSFDGMPVAVLCLEGGAVTVRIAEDDATGAPGYRDDVLVLRKGEDCARAFDAVARRFLEVEACPGDAAVDDLRAPDPNRGSLDLGSLREAVDESRQLSEQEYMILDQSLEDE